MMEHPRIEIDPDIMVGKPVIKGTRLTVEFVIGLLAAEWTEQDILDSYPGVVREDVVACLAYARDMLMSERTYLTTPSHAAAR
jgi:uncharacterized protein (DUF433 family)